PWTIGQQPTPSEVDGEWDVIVHTAASTRWTMTRAEATVANIDPLRAVLPLAGPSTHLVHLSTAYLHPAVATVPDLVFGRYRNEYEWSKGVCEELAGTVHRGPLTIVRPPLVIGAETDGAITRTTGPYTIMQSIVSGLAAAMVGDPAGY